MRESRAVSQEIIHFAPPQVTSEDIDAVVRVLQTGWLTTGSECCQFEAELSRYLEGAHVIAVNSCTAALEICLAALDLPPGSLVAVPTWTFAATGLAVHRVGSVPILVDIDPATLNMSPDSLAAALDAHDVAAVIPVHLGGTAVSPEIRALCAEREIPIVEDAAHALGTFDDRGRVNGRNVAAACFSFYVTKNLCAAEGGAIATFDGRLAEFARSYRLHGLDRDAWARYQPGASGGYEIEHPGIKANFPDILAALARSQLRRFDDMQLARRLSVSHYRRNLEAICGCDPIPRTADGDSADHLMLIELAESVDRQQVQTLLTAAGIVTSVHFRPLHTYLWFEKNSMVAPGGLWNADRMEHRVLSLPLHASLSVSDVDRVCDALAAAVRL